MLNKPITKENTFLITTAVEVTARCVSVTDESKFTHVGSYETR